MAQFDRALADGVVTVRPFDRSDRDALLRSRDDDFLRFLGEGSSEPAPRTCICVAVTIVGWIDYDDERHWLQDDEVNVGYNVFAEHRGKGYGTRALRLLCRLLEAQVPLLRPTLLIDPDNAPSLALAARAGFEQVGNVDGECLFKPSAVRS